MGVLHRIIGCIIISIFGFSIAQAKLAIIIDTDLGKDDWAAIAYLINSPAVDIRAITIEGSGESDCVHGLFNLSVALQKWGRQEIPIACDNSLGIYKTHFPKPWRNPGSTYFHHVHIAHPSPPKIYASPAKLIIDVLKNSNEQIIILAIGPYINLSNAVHLNKQLMTDKVKTIYVTGGNFTQKANKIGYYYPDLTNQPRSWNFFIAPKAAHELFSQPFNFVLNSMQSEIQIKRTNLLKQFKLNQSQLNRYGRLINLLENQQNSPYWADALTAVMMLNPFICQYNHLKMKILYKNYPSSGISIISSQGQKISYCSKINYPKFREMFMLRMLK